MSFRVFYILILAFFISVKSHSQSRYQKVISFSFETGPLISNGTEWGDELKDLVKYRGIDAQIGWKKMDPNLYSYIYRYPTFGLGVNVGTTQTREIGKPMAVYGYFDIPFSIPSQFKRVHFGYFTQIGIGFNLNPYDEIRNPENQFIGSKVNSFIHFGLNSKVVLTERVNLKANLGVKHYSNGSTKKPNAGINLVPINFGAEIKLGSIQKIQDVKLEFPKPEFRSYWNFALYTGFKNYEIGDPSYFRGGIGVNYLIQPSYKYRLGLGMDMFWAQGMEDRFPGSEFSFKSQTSLAIVGSWEWQLSERLYLPIGLGAYLFYNEINQEVSWFYERIGLRYRFKENFFTGVQIKAHKAKADFFEFTFGYTIPSKN